MSLMTMPFLSLGNPCSARLSQWLGRYQAKELARLFSDQLGVTIEVRTARGWKAGNWPQGQHLQGMVALWGESFLMFVFAPLLGDADLALDRVFDRLERQISLLRQKVADETIRGAHMRGAARAVVAGAFAAGQRGGDDLRLGEQSSGIDDQPCPRSAGRVLRRTAQALMVVAVLHGPIADVFGLGDFGARITRTVRARAGRNDILVGGGVA